MPDAFGPDGLVAFIEMDEMDVETLPAQADWKWEDR